VNPIQAKNPVLLHIKSVPYSLSAMVPDFIFGPTRAGLYLSLRFHLQNPVCVDKSASEGEGTAPRVSEAGKERVRVTARARKRCCWGPFYGGSGSRPGCRGETPRTPPAAGALHPPPSYPP
jgi:hypothetical protein